MTSPALRPTLLICCLGGFLALGLLDLANGQTRTGMAAVALFLANLLLLT
ncbi:hypothetical protein GKE82_23425 [Conexibacter sp. W3-3-2]|nr:hypothetical protein [Conexibacter sp. W3-3-2]MTD47156.1 hypothetical protein [Conexibacter sp. W3-3-2]